MREDRLWPTILVLIWLVSTLLWFTPGVTIPDGAGYFVYLPSTWLDRDLLFFNEWDRVGLIPDGRIRFKEITGTNHLGNHWTVGPALYWAPSFVAAHQARQAGAFQAFARNGFSLPYNVAVAAASAFAGLATLLLGYFASRRFAPPWAAALAAVAIWFGTPLLWYSLKNSLVAHSISSLACALIVLLSLRLRERGLETSLLLGLGLAIGFAFVVRPQNAPFALVPLFLLDRGFLRRIWIVLLGGFLAVLPQLVVSQVLYGSPVRFLQGDPRAGWIFFERVWTWEPILSWYHGLVSWSPIVILAILGWMILLRSDRRLAAAAMFCFLTQWAINATLDRSFWGGFAFGQRRFDNCAIFFILGSAALFVRMPRVVAVLAAVIPCAWTMLLFLAASTQLDLNRYYPPGELLSAIGRAVASPPLGVLAAVPEGFKASVLIVLVLSLMLMALLTVLVVRGERFAPYAIAAYFVLMAGLMGISGSNDRGRISAHQHLIDANRTPRALARLAEWRVELLKNELDYLERSGRTRAAERTRRDLADATQRLTAP